MGFGIWKCYTFKTLNNLFCSKIKSTFNDVEP